MFRSKYKCISEGLDVVPLQDRFSKLFKMFLSFEANFCTGVIWCKMKALGDEKGEKDCELRQC